MPLSQYRLQGYVQALRRNGISVESSYITVHGDFTYESGAQALIALMALPTPPTAIFCHSDVMAIGALFAGEENGAEYSAGSLHRRLRRHQTGAVVHRPAADHRGAAALPAWPVRPCCCYLSSCTDRIREPAAHGCSTASSSYQRQHGGTQSAELFFYPIMKF
jgi:hypothetical protein